MASTDPATHYSAAYAESPDFLLFTGQKKRSVQGFN